MKRPLKYPAASIVGSKFGRRSHAYKMVYALEQWAARHGYEGRKVFNGMCKSKPYLKTLIARRAWNTRRRNDPDDTWVEKYRETRRTNAEKRGYWITPEGIENMRKAHIGNTREVVAQKRLKREQQAIRNKLGMR